MMMVLHHHHKFCECVYEIFHFALILNSYKLYSVKNYKKKKIKKLKEHLWNIMHRTSLCFKI